VAVPSTSRVTIPKDGALVFAVDVPRTSWVSGEVILESADDLRPGLRASVLCDATLVAAPMSEAAEWGIREITDAAPAVTGFEPPRRVMLRPWLMRAGRRYLTIAGPHFRAAGAFATLRVETLDRPVEEPVYRFAFISDTHVRRTGPRTG
jgi:hypothetical protein